MVPLINSKTCVVAWMGRKFLKSANKPHSKWYNNDLHTSYVICNICGLTSPHTHTMERRQCKFRLIVLLVLHITHIKYMLYWVECNFYIRSSNLLKGLCNYRHPVVIGSPRKGILEWNFFGSWCVAYWMAMKIEKFDYFDKLHVVPNMKAISKIAQQTIFECNLAPTCGSWYEPSQSWNSRSIKFVSMHFNDFF
jgi:hypothetical protein